jgi:hypothetical protein
MTTHDIERGEWEFFMDVFSRQHAGWTVTVEVFAQDGDARVEAEGLPFEGISVGSAGGERQTISVMVGGTPEGHLTHTIAYPTHVILDQSGIDAGLGETLEVISGDGARTLVRFHAPVLPEQLDGLPSGGERR